MTELVNLLYGIPIVGLIFQFIGYLIVVIPDIAPIIMRAATPIAFAALCGVICERSGVVNIGIEGIMLDGRLRRLVRRRDPRADRLGGPRRRFSASRRHS